MKNKIPCGRCDCGIYSIEASLNKKARKFGAMEAKDRLKNMPKCKKNPEIDCVGCVDFHEALIDLDKRLESN